MNVLLTNAPAPRWTPFFTNEKLPPLGLGFLASSLRAAGHRVFFIDNYLRPTRFVREGFLNRNRIDLVGLYISTVCFQEALKILRAIQRQRRIGRWRGMIAVGGPHVSVAPETIPHWVDYVVAGEGERAIVDIADGACRERFLKNPPERDLDRLPPPAWDLFAPLPYQGAVSWTRSKYVFSMNTSRGCPFKCTFCSVQGVWGRTYRSFSAERVLDDIQRLVRDYDAKGICFREDHFTLSRRRTVDVCEGLLERNLKIGWVCETRADSVDRELLALMKRSGCKTLYVGVESGSPRMLELLRKGETVEDFRNLFRWARELGVQTSASFIVGVPGETPDDRRLTTQLAAEIKPDVAGFNVFLGLPGSPLYDQLKTSGDYSYRDRSGILYVHRHNVLMAKYHGYQPRMRVPRPVYVAGFETFDFLRRFALRVEGKIRRICRDLRNA